MRKRTFPRTPLPALLALAVLLPALAALAQTDSRVHLALNDIRIDADHGSYLPGSAVLSGGVVLTAPQYDVQAETVDATLAPGGSGFSQVTADGDPMTGTPLIGHFHQPALGRDYTMRADHAVYVPDQSRPQGGRIDFTGHPVMTLDAPRLLAKPSVTAADHITVLLGDGAGFPQVQFDHGHTVLTPLHP